MSNDLPKFNDSKATIFGISCDSWFVHKAFKEKLGLKHVLLSDLHRTASKAFGLHREDLNCSERATVIVDKGGIVRYVKVQEIKNAREDNDILKALATLS
jgi:peroxiredoxin